MTAPHSAPQAPFPRVPGDTVPGYPALSRYGRRVLAQAAAARSAVRQQENSDDASRPRAHPPGRVRDDSVDIDQFDDVIDAATDGRDPQ